MKCPIDQSDLVMAERQGIEIDYCPKCRGVWLDRGELDKVIERSAAAAPASAPADRPASADRPPPRRDDDRRYRGDDDRRPYEDYHRKRRKRGSFLEELFDFDFD